MRLIFRRGIFLTAIDGAEWGLQEYLQVKSERPILDVVKIGVYPIRDRGVATQTAYLCEPRHTGLHLMLQHI